MSAKKFSTRELTGYGVTSVTKRYVAARIMEGETEWSRRLLIDRGTWEREFGCAPRLMIELDDGETMSADVTANATTVSLAILAGTPLGACRVRLPRISFDRALGSDPSGRSGEPAGVSQAERAVDLSQSGAMHDD